MNNFKDINTANLKHGQRLTAAEFRQLANTKPINSTAGNGQVVKAAQKKKKKKKKKVNHGVELPWYVLFLEEKLRLDADPIKKNMDKEYYYQVSVMLWFAQRFEVYKLLAHASPNGGLRNMFEAMRLKRAGAQKGQPDLQFSIPKNGYCGLFIEMKKTLLEYGKDPTVGLKEVHYDQHKVRVALNEQGFLSVVCFGYEEAISVLEAYFYEKTLPSEILNRWDGFDWEKLAKRT